MKLVIGFLEIFKEGFGFLRNIDNNFDQTSEDIFVPASIIKKLNLREGVLIEGAAELSKKRNTNLTIVDVFKVNNRLSSEYSKIKSINDLVSINPSEKYQLTQHSDDVTGKTPSFLDNLMAYCVKFFVFSCCRTFGFRPDCRRIRQHLHFF